MSSEWGLNREMKNCREKQVPPMSAFPAQVNSSEFSAQPSAAQYVQKNSKFAKKKCIPIF